MGLSRAPLAIGIVLLVLLAGLGALVAISAWRSSAPAQTAGGRLPASLPEASEIAGGRTELLPPGAGSGEWESPPAPKFVEPPWFDHEEPGAVPVVEVRIAASGTPVRDAPDATANVVGRAALGSQWTVRGWDASAEWLQVELGTTLGWLRRTDVQGHVPAPRGAVPDFPELATQTGWLTEGKVFFWPPGTFDIAPGMDYDFELEFEDRSDMWDWSVRDRDACYDGLRARLGEGLAGAADMTKLTLMLGHPPNISGYSDADLPVFDDAELDPGISDVFMPVRIWYDHTLYKMTYPEGWSSETVPHLDFANVTTICTLGNEPGHRQCIIMPFWGNSGSLFLDAAATLSVASALMHSIHYEEKRHFPVHDMGDAYLVPMSDYWVPAGQGHCFALTRQTEGGN